MRAPAGYSGTPLAKKLGIKEGFSIMLYNPPKHYFSLFEDFPKDVVILDDSSENSVDFIHIFVTTLQELQEIAGHYKPFLKMDGALWLSWPKGASSIPTNLKREPVREHLISIGLVDVKVAAVDQDWSGLKFVYRLKDRS
ncbi:DUF3052 domain-containing protein [Flagellimonas sp. W118]|uniref:DUF3052 domain-containing protein n=1 Tax=Flagellimonas sp. W118 TaxID=3410791 RepID=UPI003BF4E7A6